MIIKERKTNETDIKISLELYGVGNSKIETGVPFLDHMLDQIARHGLMDLTLTVKEIMKLMIIILLKILE